MTNDLNLFEEETRVGGPKAGIVVVAVASFLVGALLVTSGIIAAQGGFSMALYSIERLTAEIKLTGNETRRLFEVLRTIVSASSIVAMAFGVLCLAAGIGVAQRRAWGRGLSLLLGLAASPIALLAVAVLDLPGVVLYGSYALIAPLILRDKDYARQFQ